MPEDARALEYYYITVPNKAGSALPVLAALKDAGVNLLAFSGFPQGRRAQLDFVPEDPAAFRAAAKKLKLEISPRKTAFLVQGSERCGVAAELMKTLGDAGISLTSMQVLCAGAGRYGAVLWVAPEDVRKTKRLLGAV